MNTLDLASVWYPLGLTLAEIIPSFSPHFFKPYSLGTQTLVNGTLKFIFLVFTFLLQNDLTLE